jgi:Mg2+-importing ATPase
MQENMVVQPPVRMPAPAAEASPEQAPTLRAVLEQLHTSEQGLTSAEAQRRLAQVGPNDPAPRQHATLFRQIAAFVANPLVVILLIAGLISGLLGEMLNATIIVVMVLLSIALNVAQTYRSQRAAEQLRKEVGLTATVLRDGAWQEIPRHEVVPGDIIRLVAGDLVPADARLIAARDLHVQESALTGESLPVEKAPDDAPAPARALSEMRNRVFLGTSVVSGTAIAVIVATGSQTVFGDIAARLATRAPRTEFERGLQQFGLLITRTVMFLVLFVVLVNLAFHRDPFESFLFAVALAVGLTPEFLPMITTVTLGNGALRMARQQVIVKNLAAIQHFGSMDVLCSDKTGTLTSGEMTLADHLDPLGTSDERVFLFAYLNSLFETGTENPVDMAIRHSAHQNPLDLAILRYEHPDVHAYHKLDEMPFDFERRRQSIVVAHERDTEELPDRLLITKGAPESVLPVCVAYAVQDQQHALDPATHARCTDLYRRLSGEGYRVLAVAMRAVPQQAAYHADDEHDLVLIGFLTFADPPLDDARDALQALHRDGVVVKILTGDNELVAQHVCSQVGLAVDSMLLGDDVDAMNDPALAHVAEQTTVFARVSPAQKNRIITALKSRGHVVGFLGDGINDAPSLHAADVGISVSTATDVAKDAASIILMQRSLRVLHTGIIEGRKAFGNVMKYLLMGTSSNFGNMFSMAGAALFLPFLPMLPTQILLNNFLYDLAQVAIPTDRVDASFIRKPRRWDLGLIRNFMIVIGPISSLYDFLTFWALLAIFHASEAEFHTGWFVESLATQTLVLFVIRTAGNPMRSRPSRALALTAVATVLIGCVLPFTPLAAALGFTPLPAAYFLFLLVMTATYLLLVEAVKRRLMRRIAY